MRFVSNAWDKFHFIPHKENKFKTMKHSWQKDFGTQEEDSRSCVVILVS